MRLLSLLGRKKAGLNNDVSVTNDTTNDKLNKDFVLRSQINSEYSQARFDNGDVYAQTPYGEVLIGYYDKERAYDENKGEIASFKIDDGDAFIQFNRLGHIKKLQEMFSKLIDETNENALKETYRNQYRQQTSELTKFLYANASKAGYIEDVQNGDVLAYLEPRSSNNDEAIVLGMAAAFACLQKFVWSDENKYSSFYK